MKNPVLKNVKIAILTPKQIQKLKEYEEETNLVLVAYKSEKNQK